MRTRAVTLLAALGLVVVPFAAHAGGQATIASPGADQQLSGSVSIQADVVGDNRDTFGNGPDHQVTARLSDSSGGGAASGTSSVALSCIGGNCNANSTWGGVSMSPASFAPFGRPSRVCNGAWFIQVDVDGGGYGATRRVLVSQLPGSPTGFAVSGGQEQASLAWDLGGEADLAGYRIQRRATGASVWDSIGEVSAPTTSYTDAVDHGSWEYRVLALRPDGRGGNGAPTTICQDSGRELTAASSSKTVSVTAPPAPTPTPTPTPTPSASPSTSTGSGGSSSGGSTSGGSTSGGSTSGGNDGTTPDNDGTTPATGGTTPDNDPATPTGDAASPDNDGTAAANDGTTPDDGAAPVNDGTTPDTDGTTPRPGAGPRVRPPTRGSSSSLSLGTGTVNLGDDGTAPQVAGPGRERDRYFGEDSGFTEEIDFGDTEAIGSTETLTRTVTTFEDGVVEVPGAFQSVFGEELAIQNIFNSIASGLVLLALSLHLRRWNRDSLAEI